MKKPIYLDNAATTFPKPQPVYEAVERTLRSFGNAGRGGNRFSKAAATGIYDCRCCAAGLFGVSDAERVSFQPGATFAINTALFGTIKPGMKVLTTAVEHNAVARPLKALERRGVQIYKCSCDAGGRLDLNEFSELCKIVDVAVVVHASNVSAVVFPLEQIAAIAAAQDVKLIIDASQTAGTEPIDFDRLKLAALICSGHKGLFGITGAALLILADGLEFEPLVYGGTGSFSETDVMPEFLPDRLESGTQNAVAIAALHSGLSFIAETGMEQIREHELKLADYLRRELMLTGGVSVHGATLADRRTNVVSVAVKNFDSAELEWRLDEEYGIAVRSGLQCSPWSHATLGTLPAGTVRFSPGWFNSEADIEQAIFAIRKIIKI